MRRTILALLLVCLCLLTACSSAPQETTAPTASETTVPTETEPAETISPVAEEKEVIVYFANWYLDTKTAEEGAEVCSIPWDKVTCINPRFLGGRTRRRLHGGLMGPAGGVWGTPNQLPRGVHPPQGGF